MNAPFSLQRMAGMLLLTLLGFISPGAELQTLASRGFAAGNQPGDARKGVPNQRGMPGDPLLGAIRVEEARASRDSSAASPSNDFEELTLTTVLVLSNLVLWLLVLYLIFRLLGTLRALGLLSWQLEQLRTTPPSPSDRDGLWVGRKAPDFTLPCTAGVGRSLHDYAGRSVLLVFTQSRGEPCQAVIKELNRLHDQGEPEVLVVSNGSPDESRQWARATGVRFPVLAQPTLALSKRYQVFAMPFAFLIDGKGIIASKGTIASRQHLGYVLTAANKRAKDGHVQAEPDKIEKGESERAASATEESHV